MNSEYFMSWFMPLYDSICEVMQYNCYPPKSCNQTCPEGQSCVPRKFLTAGEKPYYCKFGDATVFWNSVKVSKYYK